ncbi:MAG: sigma-70 family RNA polymerase sigma factor [Bacteroidia bacterium]|nr:sigma-70 family RNA polymerase sigma factor [Bacteroidia bacterium]
MSNPAMVALEEKNLLEKLRQPETKNRAFERLVQLYQRMLYFHIRRIVIDHDDADDVLQNTLLKAWKNIDRFRADSALKTWLYRIATNEALSFLSSKQKRGFDDVADIENDLRHSLSSGKYIDGDEVQKKLQHAILTLPKQQRLVFNMRYYDEMKYEEIAEVLEVSVGALKANYHHAVKKIENFLTSN